MKRICFITQCSLPVPAVKGGAVETLVEYLLDENEKYRKYFFTVISVFDQLAEKQSKKYEYTDFIFIRKANSKVNSAVYLIYRVLKHLGIYIPYSLEFAEVLRYLRKEKKYDYYIHEAGATTQLPALSRIVSKEKLLAHLHWNGMGNRRKDSSISYMISVSDYIGACWRKDAECNESKVITLHNGVRTERFQKMCTNDEKRELRNKLEIPQNNTVIIFVGRIVEEKGVRELIQAFHELEHEEATLLIIGSANFGVESDTSYEEVIKRLADKETRQIVFTGFVPHMELYRYYSIADIAVVPSLFQDPAPLVCIETLATGTPLVATRVGGIAEYAGEECSILIDNDAYFVENLSKTIDHLIEHPELRLQMGEKGRLHAEKFSVDNYYKNFCILMDEIMGE